MTSPAAPGSSRSLALPLLLATLAAFVGVLAGKALYYRDIILLHRPIRMVVRSQWSQGWLPVWDPLQDGGRVLLANPNHRILHPTALLDLFLDVDHALAAAVLIQVFLAGWGLALLLRERGLPVSAARLGGLAYALSGPILSLGNLPNLMGGVAWVPLIVWATLRAWRRPAGWLPLAAGLAAVPLLAGGVESLATALVLLVILALLDREAVWLKLGGLLVVAGGGVLLACIQILPALAILGASERGVGFRPEQVFHWSMPPWRFLEAVVPGLWGTATDPLAWRGTPLFDGGEPLILSAYLGVTTCLLALVGWAAALWPHGWPASPARPAGKDRSLPVALRHLVLATTLLGGGLMLLVLGRYNPLLSLLRDAAQLYPFLRYPERLLPLATLPVSVAAAAGWQVLAQARSQRRALPRSFWWAGGLLGCTLLVTLLVASQAGLPGLVPGEKGMGALISSVLAAVLAVAGLGGAVWLAGGAGRLPFAAALLFLVVAVDLLAAGESLNPTVSSDLINEQTAAARFLNRGDPWPERGVRLLRNPEPRIPAAGLPRGVEVFWARQTLSGEMPLESSLATALVKDVDRSAPLGNAFLRVAHDRAQGDRRSRLADRAAATWEVGFRTGPGAVPENVPFQKQVLPGVAPVVVWPRPSAAPRISLVPRGIALGDLHRTGVLEQLVQRLGDPASSPSREVFMTGNGASDLHAGWDPELGEVQIRAQAPTRLEVVARAPGAGILVVRDSFLPGWSASVDGEPVRILRTDLAWRGVPLSAGEHVVIFRYRQPGLVAGALLSGLGLLLMVCLLVGALLKRRILRRPLGREPA